MQKYKEFIEIMKRDNLNKEAVIDVLNIYINGHNFIQRLEDFKNKEGERREYNGVIYSDEYEKDNEEYFGQNKVLFYSGDGDDDYDIVSYSELYQYLITTCEFYIKENSAKKEIVEELLMKIKDKYVY
ncbi:ribonuclease toxin immunity protein CdiI [Priestia koreensis]|uniref:ribonuclease toxin immunity protein CdiI n=1 Tax=Priestia koreensis TaxID=284581 RepID=UPI0028F6D5FC|nr:ribonuclease toxin immunity protein CdiI [Priestia koreensis]